MPEKIKKYLNIEFFLIFAILLLAFTIRVFRIDQTLNFFYDQGRDALVIWELIHSPHKLFLIGPTTGLAGVFRGPFYYYLIAPFYWLGRGNPLYPEVFLVLTSIAALWLMYVLAKEIGGKTSAIITLLLGSFSFEIIYASRWLSNPTPMLLLSMLLVWSLFKIYDGKKNYWILLSLILGLSFFSFGSSGELFYFPAVAFFAVWQFFFTKRGIKKIPNVKILIASVVVFLLTFAPLFIFNLRHGNILENGVLGQMGSGKSFGIPTWRFVLDRLNLVWTYFSSLIAHSPYAKEQVIVAMLSLTGIYFLPRIIKNDKAKIILILLVSVVAGSVFYVGNYGNFYQYYLTGYYLIFLLLAGVALSEIFKNNWLGKIAVVLFLYFFLTQNWSWIKPYVYTTGLEPDTIVYADQAKAIDWVYQNADGHDFNVDEYVPPVITYEYDYLFKWLGTEKYHKLPDASQVPLLFTLYEVDPPNPQRLQAWLDRQKGIGKVVKEETFGGLTVQMRIRIDR